MPLNTNDDVEGLLFILSTSKLMLLLDKKGLNHKIDDINQAKRKVLYDIGLKISPNKPIDSTTNILDILNTPSVTQLNANIASFNETELNSLSTLLDTQTYRDDLKNIGIQLDSDPTLADTINPYAVPFGAAASKATSVLNQINSGNYYELVKSTNILTFMDNAGKWTNTNIDNFIKNLPSKEIDDVIDNIPILSTLMPNFSSFTSTLNSTNLTSMLTPSNTFCNPCLVNFLNLSGLKTDIMTFLNSNVTNANTWLNGHLEKLSLGVEQFQLMADSIFGDIQSFESLQSDISNLINSLLANLIPTNSDKCSPVLFLISMLKAFSLGIATLLLNPLKLQFDGLNLQIKEINEFFNTLQALRNLIPQIDC